MRPVVHAGVALALWFFAAPSPARADVSDETRTRALNAIIDAADKICGSIPTSGEQSSITVKGDVKAQLSGLARKLADLGISGSGDLNSATYEGVLQQDLPAALKDARGCKMHIFDMLQEKLLPNQKSGGILVNPLNARIEGDIKVGEPFITDVLLRAGGKEAALFNTWSRLQLYTANQWSNGIAKALLSTYASGCMTLAFSESEPVRIAYPDVIYNWNLPSNDPMYTPTILVTEEFMRGAAVFAFSGCLISKSSASDLTHRNAFCFYYWINQPSLSVNNLGLCPWGQQIN